MQHRLTRMLTVVAALAVPLLLSFGPVAQPASAATYNDTVLGNGPVLFFDLNDNSAPADLTGNGHTGTWHGNPSGARSMPNGVNGLLLNGTSQYLSIPSTPDLSITNTGQLTLEAWISPTVVNQPTAGGNGYIHWLSKCGSGSCEYKGRLYNANYSSRPSRISGYAFNPSGGLGSGAYWQPAANVIQAGQWYHVVIEYDLNSTPSWCPTSSPGSVNIWVNGVEWDSTAHGTTGCMSQYSVNPVAGNAPLIVGSDLSSYFEGSVAKLAVYDKLLTQAEISADYTAMTGTAPSGSCGSSTCSLSRQA